ncbi:MAG: hypothetical protein FVQ82_13190 [Planctomycetes bacterium]|nr:hypothetical protein [Planctomycetota bacterium]
MKKKMEELEVYVSEENNVCIKGSYDIHAEVDSIVIMNPEQVDVVIQWLQEAKSEAMQNIDSPTEE